LAFYTDQNGDGTLYVSAMATSKLDPVTASCGSGAGQRTITIDPKTARPVTAAAPIAPIASDSDVQQAIARLGFDPRSATPEQLIAAHLPTRPPATTGTASYNAWLKAAVTPIQHFVTTSTADPNVQHTTTFVGYPNWSGYTSQGPQGTFQYVQGYWTIPADPVCATTFCESAIWVGIDGNGPVEHANVFQEGVDINATHEKDEFGIWLPQFWDFVMWHEYYPVEPSDENDFNVAPGDTVFCSTAQVTGSGVSVRHYCEDLTSGTASSGNWSNVGSAFAMDSAEWILERPTLNGSDEYDLTDVGSVLIYGAEVESGGTYLDYGQTATYWNLENDTMLGVSGDTLATGTATSSDSELYLNWVNYY